MIRGGRNIEDLIASYLANELNSLDSQRVEEWLAEGDENIKLFEEYVKTWSSVPYNENAYNADQAWMDIKPLLQSTTSFTSLWKVAAAVIILLGSYFTFNQINSSEEVLLAQNEVIKETLVDGSNITINKNSELIISGDFNDSERRVKLKGEAFFAIEKNPEKPFVIEMEQSQVKVLGTSFNITADPKDKLVEVYVKSGVVLFEYQTDSNNTYLSIKLLAGDKVVYNKDTKKLEKQEKGVDANADLYWMDQQLIFDGIKMEKVAKILEAVYEVKIDFSNPSIGQCPLTVNFQNASIEEIIEVVGLTFNLEVEQSDKHYYFKGDGCQDL